MDSTTDYSRKVAADVSAALTAAGINTLTASERTGIPRTTLNRRLLGTSAFTIVELELVAALLGVTVDHFLTEGAAA